jgi:predicted peptidase
VFSSSTRAIAVTEVGVAQQAMTFLARDGTEIPYLLHLPPGHASRRRRRWPLVLHLHGAGERGRDPWTLLQKDLPRRLEHAPRFGFIVVSPQCPQRTTWTPLLPVLLEMLDELVPALRANVRRVHVTGPSMGGSGTWQLIALDPGRFASAVPICASVPPLHGWPGRAARAASVSVWAFQGARDPVIPVSEPRALRAAHREGGGRSRLTVLPGVGHEVWTPAYANPRLWTWVMNRRRPPGGRA